MKLKTRNSDFEEKKSSCDTAFEWWITHTTFEWWITWELEWFPNQYWHYKQRHCVLWWIWNQVGSHVSLINRGAKFPTMGTSWFMNWFSSIILHILRLRVITPDFVIETELLPSCSSRMIREKTLLIVGIRSNSRIWQ